MGTPAQLQTFPGLGFSWEGFAIEQVISLLDADRDAYFYRTHAGAELDLMITRGGRRHGFEMKYADAPTITKSMRVALEDLRLDRLWVIFPGKRAYRLSEKITALPLSRLMDLEA